VDVLAAEVGGSTSLWRGGVASQGREDGTDFRERVRECVLNTVEINSIPKESQLSSSSAEFFPKKFFTSLAWEYPVKDRSFINVHPAKEEILSNLSRNTLAFVNCCSVLRPIYSGSYQ
jgi:hypothetical protein